jgi:dTDP-4-dehydrorhamnose 3,5-epimerase
MSNILSIESLGSLREVLLIKNKVFGDDRGFFLESFNSKSFQDATGLAPIFVQDNLSRSNKGVLRGIHYQRAPHTQGKLVRVVNGAVFDVAVDLRRSSQTFGQWAGCELNGKSGEVLWIPPGFGHAFLVLEDRTDFLYKTTDYYTPQSEASIAWDDPQINIGWPKGFRKENIILSVKDKAAPLLIAARVFD